MLLLLEAEACELGEAGEMLCAVIPDAVELEVEACELCEACEMLCAVIPDPVVPEVDACELGEVGNFRRETVKTIERQVQHL